MACDVGLRVVGCRRSWMFAKRAAKDGCGSSEANEPEEFLQAICRCAGPAQLACRAGGLAASRLIISMLSVSLFCGRGHFKREFHKELTRNFMEPCAENWSLFVKLGRRQRHGQSWRCRSRRPCAVVLSSLRTTVRPTRRGAWIGRNHSCISRRNCCKTNIP